MRPGGAVRFDLELAFRDLPRQKLDVRHSPWPRAGQPDICEVDAEFLHQVQDPDLVFDPWIFDRRRLQTVTQRLVVKQDFAWKLSVSAGYRVPIVDEM